MTKEELLNDAVETTEEALKETHIFKDYVVPIGKDLLALIGGLDVIRWGVCLGKKGITKIKAYRDNKVSNESNANVVDVVENKEQK